MKTKINYYLLLVPLALFAFANITCKKKKEALPPVLMSVEPVDGMKGDPLTVTGSNLENAISVTVGGVSSKIIQNSGSILTTVVPDGASEGIGSVAVQTSTGISNSIPYKVLKTPVHVDNAPPTLSKTIPAANYSEYPLLIYGDNLSGIIRISFNNKAADIYTNNKRVVTTTVPKGLPAGKVQVKVETTKGISTVDFEVLGPPPAGPANVNFNIVNIPPPNFVPAISNQWDCGLFSRQDGNNFVELNSGDGFENFTITGRYEYDFDKPENYNKLNYVEFTNEETGETFAGHFSSAANNPCVLTMVLISSKTGQVTFCRFDRRDNDPDLVCD